MHITIGYLAVLLFSFWFIGYVFNKNKVKYKTELDFQNLLFKKYGSKND
jgi:hypothetical protein